MLDNGPDCGAGVELIKRADLGGILIGDVLHAQRARERRSQAVRRTQTKLAVAKYSISGVAVRRRKDAEHGLNIALPVDGMVPFVGGGDIEVVIRVADVRAYEIAERTVSAEERAPRGDWCAADRIVATGAIR